MVFLVHPVYNTLPQTYTEDLQGQQVNRQDHELNWILSVRGSLNKYECIYYISGTAWTPGRLFIFTHQVVALCCVKWRHRRYFVNVTSNRKSDSVNRCIFTWKTIPSDFIPIRFETTEPWTFEHGRLSKKNKMSSDLWAVPVSDLKHFVTLHSLTTTDVSYTISFQNSLLQLICACSSLSPKQIPL